VPLSKHLYSTVVLAICLLIGFTTNAYAQDTTLSEADVPYGVASSWLYGHYQLADGNIEEAIRHLHPVYRTHPEVPLLAWDFQEALVAGHYFNDALQVLNKMVEDWPEQSMYRWQRSNVLMQLGKDKDALADLRELRKLGLVDLDVVVSEATILAGMGEPNQALDVCREGLRDFPEDGPRLYLTMTVILDQKGRQSEIPDLLEEAVKAYPNSPQLHDIRMRGLVAVGKHKEALAVAREADKHFMEMLETNIPDSENQQDDGLEHHPRSVPPPSLVVELADLYSQRGELDKAIKILDPMFEAGELGVDPSLWLARLHLGTNNVPRGLELVDIILEKWPNSGQAWFIRGRALETEGKLEDAVVEYSKGVEYAPDDVQVRLGYIRGMLLAWENDFQVKTKNSKQLEKVETIRKHAVATSDLIAEADTEGHLILGYAFRNANDLLLAVSSFEKAAKSPDLTIPAKLQMSVCYDELDDFHNARSVLEQLRKQFPQDAEVANSLGYYLAEKGEDLNYAHELISEALESDPGTGAYLDSMGWVLYQLGQTDKAFDYMIQAVNVLPNDPVILEHLALVLLKMGQVEESEEMLRRALTLGGDKERLENLLNNLPQKGD